MRYAGDGAWRAWSTSRPSAREAAARHHLDFDIGRREVVHDLGQHGPDHRDGGADVVEHGRLGGQGVQRMLDPHEVAEAPGQRERHHVKQDEGHRHDAETEHRLTRHGPKSGVSLGEVADRL